MVGESAHGRSEPQNDPKTTSTWRAGRHRTRSRKHTDALSKRGGFAGANSGCSSRPPWRLRFDLSAPYKAEG